MSGTELVPRRPRRSAQDWRDLIEEWQGSGIDLVEFCRERRIAPSSVRWWRWRLGIVPDSYRTNSKRVLGETKDWIQLEIESPSSNAAGFELRWPSGRVLAIPCNFDVEALGRLLAVVERSEC